MRRIKNHIFVLRYFADFSDNVLTMNAAPEVPVDQNKIDLILKNILSNERFYFS
ncbi:hypothetical protein D3C86_1935780 [compost metagenome]